MNQKNINEQKLKFIKKLALEYRLSIKNICRLLGQEPTEENQQFLYNIFVNEENISSYQEKIEFKYLDYETTNEKIVIENATYMAAQMTLLKLQKALLNNDECELQNIRNNLKRIDIDFSKLKSRKIWTKVTEEEILTIAKYRVKHALSKREINRLLGIGDKTLSKFEERIQSDFWKTKIASLNAYNYDLCHISVNKRKKHD